MKKINFLLTSILLPICLSAQITFAEKKAEKPDWEYLRETLVMPYDSSYLCVQMYPILEAYKKYIGQQLFFIERANNECEIRDKNGVFCDYKRYAEIVLHKYFEIIDVISIENSVFANLKRGGDVIKYGGRFWYFQENNQNKRLFYDTKSAEYPCFVIKNIQNNDTLYLNINNMYLASSENSYDNFKNSNIILVGGFVKLKEKAVGNNVVACHHSLGLDPEIISMWKCTDVSITSDTEYITTGWGQKNQVQTNKTRVELISLVLQNSKDKNITGYVEFNNITEDFEKLSGHSCFMFEETYQKYVSEFNRKKQNYNQQAAQEKAKCKQQLTAKYGAAAAEKIIAGKYEIGMSKAVCKEIAGYATIANKTATTEVWKISNIMGYGAIYLYFTGDKLEKIVNF